jgi:ABC-2 type transport system ATP-binding protein
MNKYSIEVTDLTKIFGKFTAVDHVSFNVKEGEIFGFLGANGAGKSTTIRMLCALLQSTSGTALVGGYDINNSPEKVKENIGYMSQKFSLYEDLTIEENINFFGGIYGLEGAKLKKQKEWVLEIAELRGKEKIITRTLPGGWKQRLALGCAVIHTPKIVFLDEPTGGVDPISRRNFWDLINRLSENGTTIFVTTHFLDEAEYCNSVYLMQAGKIIAGGSPGELKNRYLEHAMLEVECENIIEALDKLSKQTFSKGISLFGSYLHIYVDDEEIGRQNITRLLSEYGIKINRIQKIVPTLEDVFIYLIEKKN